MIETALRVLARFLLIRSAVLMLTTPFAVGNGDMEPPEAVGEILTSIFTIAVLWDYLW